MNMPRADHPRGAFRWMLSRPGKVGVRRARQTQFATSRALHALAALVFMVSGFRRNDDVGGGTLRALHTRLSLRTYMGVCGTRVYGRGVITRPRSAPFSACQPAGFPAVAAVPGVSHSRMTAAPTSIDAMKTTVSGKR